MVEFIGGEGRIVVPKPPRIVRGGSDFDARFELDQLRMLIREELRREEPPSATLSELAAERLCRKLPGMASARDFEARVRKHLLPALGFHTSATLKPKHIEIMMADLARAGFAPQTINHIRDAGRQLIADAIKNEAWPKANPFALVAPLDTPRREPPMLTRIQAAQLLREVPSRWRSLFALALYLGPRRGEIFALEKEWVDLERKLVSFNGSHERDRTKTGDQRRNIPIPSELMPYLRHAMTEARDSAFVFPSEKNERLTKDTKLVAVLRDALGVVDINEVSATQMTFHGLRRVSSTLHQEAGCHPWVVSKVLGHSQASLAACGNPVENMTARRYTQFSEEFVRAELEKLSLKL